MLDDEAFFEGFFFCKSVELEGSASILFCGLHVDKVLMMVKGGASLRVPTIHQAA